MRFGVRQLLRQRGSSLVAVITLALGIGVSTAIFSIIDATMLRPLPYPNPEQLVTVSPEETMPDGRVSRATASMEDMRTWQKSDDVFSQVAGYGSAFRGRVVEGETPERIEVAHYTEDYLPMHGVTPLIGRNFTKEETDPGSQLVALLGYGYWKSRYSGRAGHRRPDGPVRHGGRDDHRRAAGVVQREDAGRAAIAHAAGGVSRAEARAACPCTRGCART